MLEQISWSSYLLAIVIVMAVYYAVIGVLYYRKELMGLLQKPTKTKPVPEDFPEGENKEEAGKAAVDKLEAVVAQIRSILEQTGMDADKDSLLAFLRETLSGYDGMSKPAFRVAINNYIISHAKELCGVGFSERELDEEWRNLPR